MQQKVLFIGPTYSPKILIAQIQAAADNTEGMKVISVSHASTLGSSVSVSNVEYSAIIVLEETYEEEED